MESYFKERERGNDAQCRGAIEVCSLNPESAFAFGPSQFSSVCVCVFGGGGLLLERVFSLLPDILS